MLTKIISSNFIEISVKNLTGAQVLWRNNDKIKIEEYLVCTQESQLFHPDSVGVTKGLKALAEPYGGSGMERNGGGSRVVTIGDKQVKGVGANLLVGKRTRLDYSWGGLEPESAIKEVIYTHMLDKVLVKGAVTVDALIRVNNRSKQRRIDCRDWSVLMVRDATYRPAHLLMPCFFFSSQGKMNTTPNIESKLRRMYARIDVDIGVNNYAKWVGELANGHAQQIASARMARIMHGCLTEANVTVEGKWLDLPLASTTNGAYNFCYNRSFASEVYVFPKFIEMTSYYYAKYNGKTFKPQPIIDYYFDQLCAYERKFSGFLLGACIYRSGSSQYQQDVEQLFEFVRELITPDETAITPGSPTIDYGNEVAESVTRLWFGVFSLFYRSSVDYHRFPDVSLCLIRVLKDNFLQQRAIVSLEHYLYLSCFIALKRCWLSETFYQSEVELNVFRALEEDHPDVRGVIEHYSSLASWIFDEIFYQKITIFNDSRSSIYYSIFDQEYILESDSGTKQLTFASLKNSLSIFLKSGLLDRPSLSKYLTVCIEILDSGMNGFK